MTIFLSRFMNEEWTVAVAGRISVSWWEHWRFAKSIWAS